MSTSRELLQELMAQGMSGRAIGRAIGRDSSLLSQIAKGRKPGDNLRPALAELRDALARGERPERVQTAPARRTTASGATARVRRKTVVGGRDWATGTVKQQAAGSGARSLRKILHNAGHADVAATVVFKPGVPVYNSSGGRRRGVTIDGIVGDKRRDGENFGGARRSNPSPECTMNLGNAAAALARIDGDFGGNVTAFVVSRMHDLGMVGDAADASSVRSLELRVWSR